jgi:hypothetical protein
MSTTDMIPPTSSSQRPPQLQGNYAIWRPLMEAFLMKNGVDKVHLKPIVDYENLEKEVTEWEDEEQQESILLARGGNISSSSSSSSVGSSTPAEDKRREQEKLKAANTLKEIREARKTVKALVSRSRRAYGFLYESIQTELQLQSASIPVGYAYGIWNFLEKKYQNTEQDNIADLYKQWNKLHMVEGESYDSYKARVDRIGNLLEKAKDKPSPGQYMYRLLYELLPDYNVVVLSLSTGDRFNLKDAINIKWDEIVQIINSYERSQYRLANPDLNEQTVPSTAASATSRFHNKGNYNNNNNINNRQSSTTFTTKPDITCNHCGEKGHIKTLCTKWLQTQMKQASSSLSSNNKTNIKCGITYCGGNHTTSEHDDNKMPGWKKAKMAAAGNKSNQRADAATTSKQNNNSGNSNHYSSLSENEEEEEESTTLGSTNPYRFASCAIVCNTMKSSPPVVKQILQREQHLMVKSTQTELDSSLKNFKNKWGIDSMASVHICGDKSKFIGPIRNCKPIPVKIADSSVITVTQIGNVKIKMYSKVSNKIIIYTLYNVLYHEKFSINLLSWGELKKLHWELHSVNMESFMISPGRTKIHLDTIDGVLILKSCEPTAEEAAAKLACVSASSAPPKLATINDLILLHQRLGHIGFDSMIKMIKENKSNGIGEIKIKDDELKQARERILNCKSCIQGKGTRTPFGHGGLDKGSSPYEVIHLDSYVMKIKSANGETRHEYGVTIIDPYSDHLSSFTTSHKDKIPDGVMEQLTSVQRQTGKRIKRIYCDGGTEFINRMFKLWCSNEGIELHWPPKETPQLNGISERHVRTYKDGTRTLLAHCGLPDRFWRMAVSYFVIVWNRSHICSTTGMTPFESVYGKKPTIKYFGVFGCDAYYHISKNVRTTLQPKMEPGIYLGHDPLRGCSIIYSLREQRYVHTRDIRLQQNKFLFATALSITGKVKEILNSPAGYQSIIKDDNNDHESLPSIPEEENKDQNKEEKEEEHRESEPIPSASMSAEEEKAIETALANSSIQVQRIVDSITATSTACSASTGIHKRELQTPKTYAEALRSNRRDD